MSSRTLSLHCGARSRFVYVVTPRSGITAGSTVLREELLPSSIRRGWALDVAIARRAYLGQTEAQSAIAEKRQLANFERR